MTKGALMAKSQIDDLLEIPEFLKRDRNSPAAVYDEHAKPYAELIAEAEAAKKAIVDGNKPEKPKKASPRPHMTPRQRMVQQVNLLAAELEGEIDKFVTDKYTSSFVLYDWIRDNGIKGPQAGMIVNIYKPQLEELEETQLGKCPQLKEAYSHLSKDELNRFVEFMRGWIDDASRWSANRKTNRKPRKLKKRSVEQTVKHIKYKKEDHDFKVTSVDPGLIVGASELWVLHTGFVKKIAVYRAVDRGGLKVHRSSIKNYDPDNSVEKRIGRNPDETLKTILEGGKVTLRKLTDSLRAKNEEPSGKINKGIILLRVIK
jgi:hypothetical protein